MTSRVTPRLRHHSPRARALLQPLRRHHRARLHPLAARVLLRRLGRVHQVRLRRVLLWSFEPFYYTALESTRCEYTLHLRLSPRFFIYVLGVRVFRRTIKIRENTTLWYPPAGGLVLGHITIFHTFTLFITALPLLISSHF